jgi:hypothetical protein
MVAGPDNVFMFETLRGPPPNQINQINQIPNHNGPSKISPAGSVASSKQSSSSGASSNYKPNVSNIALAVDLNWDSNEHVLNHDNLEVADPSLDVTLLTGQSLHCSLLILSWL